MCFCAVVLAILWSLWDSASKAASRIDSDWSVMHSDAFDSACAVQRCESSGIIL